METLSAPGRKDDGGKLRWSLLPWLELEAVVAVLEYGARKYAPGNWRNVANGYERYREAIGRHHAAVMKGEAIDPESGLPHLAHLACNCLFALFFLGKEKS
jgi:hypothetical protein